MKILEWRARGFRASCNKAAWLLTTALSALATAWPAVVTATAMGMSQIAGEAGDGPVTVYYPTLEDARLIPRGRMNLLIAPDSTVERGNGRLVVISHGSGGSPWVHADLARHLVEAGFFVAVPQHRADNYQDDSNPGPDSWKLRPAEISRAIDAVAREARFAPLLHLDKVGAYGMSAGGHTVLTLAGGKWSPALFLHHCEAHLEEDFQSCVGLFTRLTGGPLDGIKKWLALAVLRHRFSDNALQAHGDPRIAAVVAGVPSSADFDMSSFESPRVPLGLVTARQDQWLHPRFHSDRVLAACKRCVVVADLPTAGHGALLSPLPPGLTGLLGDMLNDPPGFDRREMGEVDRKIAAFFVKNLLP